MSTARLLTGRKVAWIAGFSFALVLGVNVLLAYVAAAEWAKTLFYRHAHDGR